MTSQTASARTYGGWRRRRGVGLANYSAGRTLVILLAIFAVVLAVGTFGFRTAAVLLAPVLLVVGLVLARWNGIWLSDYLASRAGFWRARRRHHTSFRSDQRIGYPAVFANLSGVLAPLRLVDADDGSGDRYGLVWDRRDGYLTAVIKVAPTGSWLADEAEAERWVANWGNWLAGLGYRRMVSWVTVTTESAPDSGEALVDYIQGRLDPGAPAAALEVVGQLVGASPVANSAVHTRVAITFDPALAPVPITSLRAAAREVSNELRGLATTLAGCGVTVLGRLSAAELAGIVRTAFDPAARGAVSLALGTEEGRVQLLSECAPYATESYWGNYRHDSGYSITWALREAPTQQVHADVLARLLAPGRWPLRVTLAYRPLSTEQAQQAVQQEATAAEVRAGWRQRTGGDITARDAADQHRAQTAALEEAAGAGVTIFTMYVTVTVPSPEELRAAAADVENRASNCRLRLRRMYASQDVGFAATLPLGIYPPALTFQVRTSRRLWERRPAS